MNSGDFTIIQTWREIKLQSFCLSTMASFTMLVIVSKFRLIRYNSLNIRSEIWERSLNKVKYKKLKQESLKSIELKSSGEKPIWSKFEHVVKKFESKILNV